MDYRQVTVHPESHIAPNATLVGHVEVAKDATILFNACLLYTSSVADDGDLLIFDDVGIAVLFVVDGDGHEFWFLSLVAFSIS